MEKLRSIRSALISVYHKDGLEPLVRYLHSVGVQLISTGGTQAWLTDLGLPCTPVESLTQYPEVFSGRVKTLHPAIFGGILMRRELPADQEQAEATGIEGIDLVVVDLYPFEDTVASGADPSAIIEKIDIGGISLIRATAKNFEYTSIISHRGQYQRVLEMLQSQNGALNLAQRRNLAAEAFAVSSHYDSAIFNWFNLEEGLPHFRLSGSNGKVLRYGENPHQKASFFSPKVPLFDIIQGKELSFNNLVDVDAAVDLLKDLMQLGEAATVIIKHTNACGAAIGKNALESWEMALACDPISAFGGVIALGSEVDKALAEAIHPLFFEILIAPAFTQEALDVLGQKKNRILLKGNNWPAATTMVKTVLDGILVQDKDLLTESISEAKIATERQPTQQELKSMAFAHIVCKHTKSNTIVLAKGYSLLASGTGQTSRIDAAHQAIAKAKKFFGDDFSGAAMASDAFFPFSDTVQAAHQAGIMAVVQPGGSVRDQDSIDYCNQSGMTMLVTGIRHFKH